MSNVSRSLCIVMIALGLTRAAAAEPIRRLHRTGGNGDHAARGLSDGGLLP